MALILDSSGVIALLNRSDDAHRRCVDAASTEDELIVPPLILVEVDYWCRKAAAGTAFASFVADIDMGAYQLARLEMSDVVRAGRARRYVREPRPRYRRCVRRRACGAVAGDAGAHSRPPRLLSCAAPSLRSAHPPACCGLAH